MSGFNDAILGGVQKLIRKAIQSPNYVTGVSGWTINKDGTVEFNNGTFRGTVTGGAFDGTDFIINSQGLFFYNGTPANGNLRYSIAPGQGTDPFNNAFVAGFAAYFTNSPPSYTQWVANEISFLLLNFTAVGTVFGTNNGTSGELQLTAPQNSTDNGASVVLRSNPAGTPAQVITSMLAAILPGGAIDSPETWHDMRPLLVNGFTAPSGDYPPQYRLNAFGEVEIWGAVTLPATYAAVTFATLPATTDANGNPLYRPAAHTQRYTISFQFAGAQTSARVQAGTSGALSLQGLPTGASGTSVWIGGRFPLDSTGLITS